MKKLLFFTLLAISLPFTAQQLRTLPEHVPVREREQAFIPQSHVFARPVTTDYLMEDFDSGIPATWQVIDSTGTGAVWTAVTEYNGQTIDGTPFVMADSDAAGSVDMDTYLESPVITVNNNGAPVYLSFDHYFRYYSGGNAEKGDVEVYDGTDWVVLRRYENQNYGSFTNPAHEDIEVTSYLNPSFKVRFHYYDANYDWFWAVDNVKIYSPNANDLAVGSWGIPYVAALNEEAFFSTIIHNNGYNTQDVFSVSVEVLDNNNTVLHTETVDFTNAGLNPQEEMKINFPDSWTPSSEGNYVIRYTVSLAGDEDNSNDSYELNSIVKAFYYENNQVYTNVGYDADNSGDLNHLGYFDPASGTFTDIDSINGLIGNFFISADFADIFNAPVLVATDIYNIIYFIDGDGQAYPYGYDPYLEDVITGIAFRDNGAPYYSTPTSLYMLNPYLDTLKIGDYNLTDPVMIGIAMDSSGTLYGVDWNSDSLYVINTTNAQVTPVGPLGIDIYYVQDIGYDRENDVLYGTLYGDDGGTTVSGLFTIDTSTGQATQIGTSTGDEYMFCAYAPSNVLNTTVITQNDWRIYPVPAQDELNVHWKILPDSWEIFDAKGKVLLKGEVMKENETIDVSNLSPGMYWMKIRKGESVSTKAFLKK